MNRNSFAVVALLVVGLTSMVFAKDATRKSDTKAEKHKPSPVWVVHEEKWPSPFRFDCSQPSHVAREHLRATKDRSAIAQAQMDKAIARLKCAEDRASRSTTEDLSTALVNVIGDSDVLVIQRPVAVMA